MTNPRVISFHYTLTSDSGEVLDSSQGSEPMAFLEGAGQIIPGLEKALLFLSIGDTRKIKVEAAEAYGLRHEQLIGEVPRDRFPSDEVKIGDQFSASSSEGVTVVRVVEVTDSIVKVDGNHPLAGMDLTFDIEITAMRAATDDEVSHGHAHGPGGVHHP